MTITESDPIFEEDGLWYFWNEVWADKLGPYESREEAEKKLEQYCREVLGK